MLMIVTGRENMMVIPHDNDNDKNGENCENDDDRHRQGKYDGHSK